MPYPTPGFVVRQTFLEFEPDDEAGTPPVPLGRPRAGSDSEICYTAGKVKQASMYGSEEMRVYIEGEQAEQLSLPPGLPLIVQQAAKSNPKKVWAEECSVVLREHICREGFRAPGINEANQPGGTCCGMAEENQVPSCGSKNHPEGCAPPCKYNTKSKGCKDGESCTFCHLCQWKPPKDKGRHQRRRAAAALRKLAAASQAQNEGEEAMQSNESSSSEENQVQ
mmetsp:Transcript_30671/g.56048  ORF Transcript_30671/g.56048 Transcript_30671/m.56048 type:complete len:223 (+) Transcript_30671:102-770(+)